MQGNPNPPRSIHALLTPIAVGVLFACLLVSYEVRVMVSWVLVPVFFVAGAVVGIRLLITLMLGARCPRCGSSKIARREVQTFGDRFYECSACHARLARTAVGPWREATDDEVAAVFAPPPEAPDPWSAPAPDPDPFAAPAAPAGPEPELSPTHAALLRQKRARSPHSPNGPGLVP